MNDNSGYLLLLFDLPTSDKIDIKKYNLFRKELIKLGFLMLQKSVYYKFLNNIKLYSDLIIKLRKISSNNGNIKVIKFTKKQFESIIIVSGDSIDFTKSDIIVEY